MNKKSFMVLGAGRFGLSLAETLIFLEQEVAIVDLNPNVIQNISDKFVQAIIGDCTDENVLKGLGILNYDVVIVAFSNNMQSSILTTVLLKELGVKTIIARATDKIHMKILEKVGADRVVLPEQEIGEKLAQQLTSSKFLEYVSLSDEFSIAEIICPKKWIEKTLKELDIRKKYNINIIAVENDDEIIIIKDPNYKFHEKDILVVIGNNCDIHTVQKLR